MAKLQGAYVQAWVWVDLGGDDAAYTDDEIRMRAIEKYADEGTCEIDEGAKVSRSYEGG